MRENVPVRFGRGRLDSLGNKGLAAYLILNGLTLHCPGRGDRRAQHWEPDSILRFRPKRPKVGAKVAGQLRGVGAYSESR